jgi:hypothetical protein
MVTTISSKASGSPSWSEMGLVTTVVFEGMSFKDPSGSVE